MVIEIDQVKNAHDIGVVQSCPSCRGEAADPTQEAKIDNLDGDLATVAGATPGIYAAEGATSDQVIDRITVREETFNEWEFPFNVHYLAHVPSGKMNCFENRKKNRGHNGRSGDSRVPRWKTNNQNQSPRWQGVGTDE